MRDGVSRRRWSRKAAYPVSITFEDEIRRALTDGLKTVVVKSSQSAVEVALQRVEADLLSFLDHNASGVGSTLPGGATGLSIQVDRDVLILVQRARAVGDLVAVVYPSLADFLLDSLRVPGLVVQTLLLIATTNGDLGSTVSFELGCQM